MKIKKSILALLCISNVLYAQENEKNVETKITSTTVFMSGAQVTREGEAQIEKGISTLIFDNVSPFINPQSVQLSGTSSVNLLSVVHRVNYLSESETPQQIKDWKDSIERLDFLLEQISNSKFVTEQQIKVYTDNSKLSHEKGSDITQIEDLDELYKKHLPALKDEILRLKKEEKKFISRKTKLQKQIDELRSSFQNGRHEVVATIKSDAVKKLKLTLQYFVSNAWWTPMYDVRFKDISSPIQLIYKANITQQTGEDWNNVKLKISTGNPSLGGTKPELATDYVRWVYGDEYRDTRRMNGWGGQEKTTIEVYDSSPPSTLSNTIAPKQQVYSNNFNINQTQLNVEFNIATPYTILSNGKENMIDAQVFEMPATYELQAAPKLDKTAFLLARVTGKEELAQLNGVANIYMDGTFTGQSNVRSDENDTLNISLGRDKSIIIERKKLKEMSSKAFFGSTKKEVSVYEISVRNTKNVPVNLTVEDQIPVTTDKDIEVNVDDNGNPTLYDIATGKLTWKLTIAAGETQKMKFGFTVKYPKSKRIGSY